MIATSIAVRQSDQRATNESGETRLCIRDRRTSCSEGTAVGVAWIPGSRKPRKSRDYRIELEGLESRTLLATIPAAVVTGRGHDESFVGFRKRWRVDDERKQFDGGHRPSESAEDGSGLAGQRPGRLVTPFLVQTVLEGAYTINGGQTWTPFNGEPGSGLPTAPFLPRSQRPPCQRFPICSRPTPTWASDRNGNLYILDSVPQLRQHSAVQLVLQKYTFTG